MNEKNKYNGWLISDSFLKRCLAVTGHYLVGGLIIWCSLLIVVGIFLGLIALLGLFLG